MSRRVALFGSVAVCLSAGSAAAFEPSGFVWTQLPVPFNVNTASSAELGRDSTLQVIGASYGAWEAPGCSGFRSQSRGEVGGDWRSGDRINTHQWFYDRNRRPRELGGRSTIGVTLSIFQGRQAVDGDILYNGIDHTWTTNPRRRGEVDAQSIITHEIGHQLGLDHAPRQDATMYAAYLGGTGSRSLSADDIDGVCSLYPSGVAPECVRDAECPAGEACRGGRCVAGVGGDGQIGDLCQGDPDCADGGLCVQADGDPFCTRRCAGACPNLWSCQRVSLGGQDTEICLPEPDQIAPGQVPFGEACEQNPDCSSGICVGNESLSFCSQTCVDNTQCPGSAGCLELRGGGGACVPEAYLPEPDPAPDPDAGVSPEADAGEEVDHPGADVGLEPESISDGGIERELVDAGQRRRARADMGLLIIRRAGDDPSGCVASPGSGSSSRDFGGLAVLFGFFGLIRRRRQG